MPKRAMTTEEMVASMDETFKRHYEPAVICSGCGHEPDGEKQCVKCGSYQFEEFNKLKVE